MKHALAPLGLLLVAAIVLVALFSDKRKDGGVVGHSPAQTVEALVAAEEWIVTMDSALGEMAVSIAHVPLDPAQLDGFFSAGSMLSGGAAKVEDELHSGIRIRNYSFDAVNPAGYPDLI